MEQADKAAELLSVPKTQDLPGLTSDQALRIISQTENICRSIEAQKEALELEEKNLTEQIKMIEPFRPERSVSLSIREIPFRTGTLGILRKDAGVHRTQSGCDLRRRGTK